MRLPSAVWAAAAPSERQVIVDSRAGVPSTEVAAVFPAAAEAGPLQAEVVSRVEVPPAEAAAAVAAAAGGDHAGAKLFSRKGGTQDGQEEIRKG